MELVETLEINGEEREIADAYARGQIATNAQNIATNAEGIAGLNNNLSELELSDVAGGKNICDIEKNYSFPFDVKIATGTKEIYTNNIPTTSDGYFYAKINASLTDGKTGTIAYYIDYDDSIKYIHNQHICDESYKLSTSIKEFGILNWGSHTGTINGIMFSEKQIKEYEPYIPSVKMLSADVDGLKSDLSAQSKVVEKHDKIINTPNVATVSGMSYNAEADEIVLNARTEPNETLADRVSWHDDTLKGIYFTMTALKEKNDSELGGLKFSASGTTLTITDGTNTWRLTAN